MVQIIISFLIFTSFLFPKSFGKKQKRQLSDVSCSTQSCETMHLHYSNLVNAKKKLAIQMKKKGQGTEPPSPISNQERLWNAQESLVQRFVCEFNFDRANSSERSAFLKFSKDSHAIMRDSLSRLEMAQCFYEITQSHKLVSQQLMKSLGGKKAFQKILNQGKPSMDY